jgi:hypothetical protein
MPNVAARKKHTSKPESVEFPVYIPLVKVFLDSSEQQEIFSAFEIWTAMPDKPVMVDC